MGKKLWVTLICEPNFSHSCDEVLTLAIPKIRGIRKLQVLPGKHNWTPPIYANGRMHCRGSQGEFSNGKED